MTIHKAQNNNSNNVNKWILYVLKIDFVNEVNEMQSYSSLFSTSNGNLMQNTHRKPSIHPWIFVAFFSLFCSYSFALWSSLLQDRFTFASCCCYCCFLSVIRKVRGFMFKSSKLHQEKRDDLENVAKDRSYKSGGVIQPFEREMKHRNKQKQQRLQQNKRQRF